MSRHCPSMDWDRHIAELDDAAAAEAAFYEMHRSLIVQVVAGLCANMTMLDRAWDAERAAVSELVDTAAEIVRVIVERGQTE